MKNKSSAVEGDNAGEEENRKQKDGEKPPREKIEDVRNGGYEEEKEAENRSGKSKQ
jgi:hypothetical protein